MFSSILFEIHLITGLAAAQAVGGEISKRGEWRRYFFYNFFGSISFYLVFNVCIIKGSHQKLKTEGMWKNSTFGGGG